MWNNDEKSACPLEESLSMGKPQRCPRGNDDNYHNVDSSIKGTWCLAFDQARRTAVQVFCLISAPVNIMDPRSIIIVGVGPFISTSLAHRLATEGWNIALLSRSQDKLLALAEELDKYKASNAKIITKVVDAGDSAALLKALEECKREMGAVDVVCYNAAKVGAFEPDCSRECALGADGEADSI